MKIQDSELNVLELLWLEGELSASAIAKTLKDSVGWSRNTTYTVIKKLVDKHAVMRVDPGFICKPLITKEEVQKFEANQLGTKLFDGAADAFLSAFVSGKKLTSGEIKRLKSLIDTLDEEAE